jgi:HEAT repeat protein
VNGPLPLLEAVAALSGLLALLATATAACKLQRGVRLRRRARREAVARPHVLRLIADGGNRVIAPDSRDPLGRTFEELSISLLPKLRGADRHALVGVLEDRGVLERARRRTARPGAVGRAKAAELLGNAGDARALPALSRLLTDRDPEVRTVAARALGKLGPLAVRPLLGALTARRSVPADIVTMALVHAGAAGADDLMSGLDPARPARVRAVAAELLGQLGALSAAASLVQALADDPDLPARTAAARSLGRLGLPEAVAPLLAALQEDEPSELRIAAAHALGRIGGDAAITALTRLLPSSEIALARAAADGLAACGAPGLAALERAAEDPASGPPAREALARIALSTARRLAVAA